MATMKMPFTILALAPFNAVPEVGFKPKIITVDQDNISRAMEEIGPSLYLPLSKDLCPAGGISLAIASMDDFSPDAIIQKNDFLKDIREAIKYLRESIGAVSEENIRGKLEDWPDLPINIPAAGPKASAPSSGGAVDDILSMVSGSGPGPTAGSSGGPEAWAAELEDTLGKILFQIFAHQDFRRHESAWRGAEVFLKQGGNNPSVRLQLCSISMDALGPGLETLQSELMEDPPSMLLVDLAFDSSARSFELLEKIACLAEDMLLPAAVWINGNFFHLSSWRELHKLSYIPHYLEEQQFAKWGRLKGLSAANWMAVTCNRFLTRLPYGRHNTPESVSFNEDKHLWVAPVWALGSLLAKRVLENGWPTRFIEYNSTMVEGLAVQTEDDGPLSATEAVMEEDRISQFVEAGIIPLVGGAGKPSAFMAKSATVAGGSVGYQFVLARMISLLFWCKDNFDQEGPAETEANLKASFEEYWKSTGHDPPEDMEISVTEENPGQPYVVGISMTPPGKVLPSGQRIELSLNW